MLHANPHATNGTYPSESRDEDPMVCVQHDRREPTSGSKDDALKPKSLCVAVTSPVTCSPEDSTPTPLTGLPSRELPPSLVSSCSAQNLVSVPIATYASDASHRCGSELLPVIVPAAKNKACAARFRCGGAVEQFKLTRPLSESHCSQCVAKHGDGDDAYNLKDLQLEKESVVVSGCSCV